MSYSRRINDYQWHRIYDYLSDFPDIYTDNEESARRFVESVFWMARSGSQWRLLPKEYGNWNVAYQRFSKWAKKGIWYKMLYYFAEDPNMEYIMIDSTILRAHACATPKKTIRNLKD